MDQPSENLTISFVDAGNSSKAAKTVPNDTYQGHKVWTWGGYLIEYVKNNNVQQYIVADNVFLATSFASKRDNNGYNLHFTNWCSNARNGDAQGEDKGVLRIDMNSEEGPKIVGGYVEQSAIFKHRSTLSIALIVVTVDIILIKFVDLHHQKLHQVEIRVQHNWVQEITGWKTVPFHQWL